MKRKLVLATLSLGLGFSSLYTYSANAQSLSSIHLEQQKNKTAQAQKAAQLSQNHQNQDSTLKQLDKLQASLTQTQSKITSKQEEIGATRDSISQLKGQIVVIQKRIIARDALLKDRVRSMYENGGAVNYLDVLLGSQNFGDFVERVFALNVIADQDKSILEDQKRDKAALVSKKAEVESQLTALNSALDNLQGLKTQLNNQKKEKDSLLASLKHQEKGLEEDMVSINERDAILASQEKAIKTEIARAQREAAQRAREEAAARQAAIEQAKQAAAQAQSSASSNNAPDPAPAPAPVTVHTGDFIIPTQGVITSGFGPRWGKFHYGVDFSRLGDHVAIWAAADGTVSRSYLSSSYGNCVFITSYINGQLYTTVYAHMRNREVVEGQSVHQGQLLGYEGQTGDATGQHLHFELHKGEWNFAKSNAVDPLPYLH